MPVVPIERKLVRSEVEDSAFAAQSRPDRADDHVPICAF